MPDLAVLSPDFHVQLATHFGALEPGAADALAAAMSPVRLSAGQTLFRTGGAEHALYLLLGGGMHVVERLPDGAETLLRTMEAGEAVDELQVLAGSRGTVEVRAATDVELARVTDADRDALARRFPQLRAKWERIQRQQLLCRLHAVFGTMDRVLLDDLVQMAEWIHRRRGEMLFEQNQTGGRALPGHQRPPAHGAHRKGRRARAGRGGARRDRGRALLLRLRTARRAGGSGSRFRPGRPGERGVRRAGRAPPADAAARHPPRRRPCEPRRDAPRGRWRR